MIRMRGRRNLRPEQGILNTILYWLNINHIPHVHVRNSGNIAHTPTGIKFVRTLFHQRGVPDILVFKAGRSYAVECKSPEGRISKEQKDWHAFFEREGGISVIARSLEEFLAAINRVASPK